MAGCRNELIDPSGAASPERCHLTVLSAFFRLKSQSLRESFGRKTGRQHGDQSENDKVNGDGRGATVVSEQRRRDHRRQAAAEYRRHFATNTKTGKT